MSKIVITGANGHLGNRLLDELAGGNHELHAVVRSAAAAASLQARAGVTVHNIDYRDAAALAPVFADAQVLVHLVGIIRETPGNRYADAHEATCMAIVAAARVAGVTPRVVYVSILGAAASHPNPCLQSKGKAEDILLDSGLPVSVLQVPMVLGEGDFATRALRRKATARIPVGFRMSSLEQPIYAGDVTAAIRAATGGAFGRLFLAGPESLTRSALVRRAGQVLGTRPWPLSLPIGLGRALVAVLEKVLPHPPMTRAMLDVLDHDDVIDPAPAARQLGLSLTPLDTLLRSVLEPLQ